MKDGWKREEGRHRQHYLAGSLLGNFTPITEDLTNFLFTLRFMPGDGDLVSVRELCSIAVLQKVVSSGGVFRSTECAARSRRTFSFKLHK